MINVYIEYGACADHVATLQDEWVYMALLPALEKLAEDNRGTLSESVFEDTRTLSELVEEVPRQSGVVSDTELDEMILAVGNAQYQLEIEYNSESDSRDGIIWNLEQLSKVELLLRNLKS